MCTFTGEMLGIVSSRFSSSSIPVMEATIRQICTEFIFHVNNVIKILLKQLTKRLFSWGVCSSRRRLLLLPQALLQLMQPCSLTAALPHDKVCIAVTSAVPNLLPGALGS